MDLIEKRVLLVKIDKAAGGSQRLSYSEPIGICYVAAFLRAHHVDCRMLHLIGQDAKGKLLETMAEYRPKVVGFSVRNFNFSLTTTMIACLRENFPGVSVVLGGECLTPDNCIELAEKADADLVVMNDGEESFLEIVSGVPPQDIPGVAFRNSKGMFRRSSGIPCRVDPASLPMMLRDGLPMHEYVSEAFPGKKYATLHTQRGCRYKCTFCHTACRYDYPLSRSVDQILDEIDLLTSQYGVEAFSIWDEDFFSDLDRVKEIGEGLIQRGCSVEWQTFMKLTDLKDPRLQKILPTLRHSGYVRAVVGLESFLPSTLKRYHKAGGPDIEESLQVLTQNDIKLCPAYIIGEPEETEADVRYGLTHLLHLRERGIAMDLPYIAFITPFPGTPLSEEYARKGLIIDHNMDHYDGEHVVVKSKCPSDVLLELRDEFYRDFYETGDDR